MWPVSLTMYLCIPTTTLVPFFLANIGHTWLGCPYRMVFSLGLGDLKDVTWEECKHSLRKQISHSPIRLNSLDNIFDILNKVQTSCFSLGFVFNLGKSSFLGLTNSLGCNESFFPRIGIKKFDGIDVLTWLAHY